MTSSSGSSPQTPTDPLNKTGEAKYDRDCWYDRSPEFQCYRLRAEHATHNPRLHPLSSRSCHSYVEGGA